MTRNKTDSFIRMKNNIKSFRKELEQTDKLFRHYIIYDIYTKKYFLVKHIQDCFRCLKRREPRDLFVHNIFRTICQSCLSHFGLDPYDSNYLKIMNRRLTKND